MANYIRTLTIFYDSDIGYKEIPLFRGAVLKCLGDKANVLFHNHTSEHAFRYSYPLIQYKRLYGKAAITCVEEGVDTIGQFLSEVPETIHVGQRELKCDISQVLPARILVQAWSEPFHYYLNRWLPLNSQNYQFYRAIVDENERQDFLEKILRGNLLSMLKGLGIHLETEILVRITQLSEPYIIYNKGIALMAFNAEFNSNLSIPNFLGIGKNASLGCGIVYKKKQKQIKSI